MSKGLRGALLAPVLGALLLLGAPSATFAAPSEEHPPAAGQDDKAQHPDPGNKDPNASKDPKAGQDPKAGKGPKAGEDPKAGEGAKPKDPKAGENAAPPKAGKRGDDRDGKDGDDDYGRRYDRDDGHYDDARYGRHYYHDHGWDTHRRYYRYGYRGSGYYDDCGYYGPDGYQHGWYDSPDACSYQYGPHGDALRSNLSGDQVVPGRGDHDAVGFANLFVDLPNGMLCYRLGYDGTPDRPTAGHIHRGGPGQPGPPAIDLHTEVNGDEGCVGADPTALRNLRDYPEAFYMQLHTAEHPDGALRGQLRRAGR